MDATDHGEQTANKNNICSLEWIAWAIEAVRRHKDDEPPALVRYQPVRGPRPLEQVAAVFGDPRVWK